jgi:arylsulfatase A-like enzyme
LEPPRAASPWWSADLLQDGPFELVANRTEVVPEPGREERAAMRKLYSRDKKRVRIPLPHPAGRLDRVRVRVWINRFDLLELAWWKGEELLGLEPAQLFPEAEAKDYTIDVPASAPRDLDRVELVVHGEGPVLIGRIELLQLAAAERLLPPPSPAAWVRAGEDVRAAWGVATSTPLQVDFTPPTGGVLVCSTIVPDTMRVPGAEPVLSLTLSGVPGEPRVHRWPLVLDENQSSVWTAVRVPLEDLAGRNLTARFDLFTKGNVESVCALTQPQIVRYDEAAPTVLLITSDTHRGDRIGSAPDSAGVRTPVLDALAAEGVLFERCQASANVTIPSHAAIFTGVSMRDTGVADNTHALSTDAATLAERFRENGWATIAAVSASHLDAAWSGLGQGFDRVAASSAPKREAGATLALLERWLADYRGRPLFIWLHLFDAHMPYEAPPPFDRRYYPEGRDPRDAALPAPEEGLVPAQFAGVRDLDFVRAQYDGEVAYLDNELARLLERPRIREAIVAFTGDHGESLGAHGIWWDHAGLYQDSLHVPLILRWPGGPRGVRVAGRVTNLELGRTLLDLAGLKDAALPGRSLLRALSKPAPAEPLFALACFGKSASITEGDEHLILHLEDSTLHARGPGGTRERHAFELYDLAADPSCTRDLAGERRERALVLRAKLIEWLRGADPRPWNAVPEGDAATLEHLGALGYAQGSERAPGAEWFPASCDCPHCRTGP